MPRWRLMAIGYVSPQVVSDGYVSPSTICEIIKSGAVARLSELLICFNLSDYVIDSTPALHLSVREQQLEVIQVLLDSGANIDQSDGEDRSALHIAVSNSHQEIVELLLSRGCRGDTPDKFGQCPIHIAVDNENSWICAKLLQYNCNVSSRNLYGKTALHIALKLQNQPLTTLLLEAGALCNIPDNNGQIALHIAAKCNDGEMVKLLATRVEVDADAKDKLDRTTLLWCVNHLNLPLLDFLCQHGVDLTTTNYFKETPLFTACSLYVNNWELESLEKISVLKDMILMLMEHGSELDALNRQGATPLQLFVRHNAVDMAQLLLLNGAHVNQTNSRGESLLRTAVKNSGVSMTEMILGFGPVLNLGGGAENDSTLLHIAAFNGERDILEILLKNGMNENTKNEEGQTPLHIAAAQKHDHIMKCLLDYGAELKCSDNLGNSPLHYLASNSAPFNVYLTMRHETRIRASKSYVNKRW